MEAPLINAKLRKCNINYGTEIFLLGNPIEATFKYERIGTGVDDFMSIAQKIHPFYEKLAAAERPVVLVGMSAVKDGIHKTIQNCLDILSRDTNLVNEEEDWNGVSYLHTAAGRVGGLDLGFVPGPDCDNLETRFLYLCNADDWVGIDSIPEEAFVIYQRSHGDKGAMVADVVLPGCAYTEKNSTFVNTDGRVQRTKPAVGPVGQARVDWQSVRALSEYIGVPLPYNNVDH